MKAGILAVVAVTACSSGAGTPAKDTGPKPDQAPATRLPDPGGVELDTSNLVQVSLISDVSQVASGQTFTVAARFRMKPGWHIYWLNPGESGLRTEVDFRLPASFVMAGQPRFPGPDSFETGTIKNYGYSGEVLVSTRVVAPQLVAGQKIQISAMARWLACRESCVRGKGLALLELTAAAASRPENQVAIARHEARLPRPWSELQGIQLSWREVQGQQQLTVDLEGAALEYFPAASSQLRFKSQTSHKGQIVLRFVRTATAARGLLRVERSGQVRYYKMNERRP
jgi:DsbC/DsbD-like thiol-disulfide interchange protein